MCIGTREDKLYPLLIGVRELNMKLYAVVSLEKYRASGNWHKKTSKKAVPIETKELLVCLLNPCCSSIYFFIIWRVLLLPDETAKTVKKANYITLINNYHDKTVKYCKFWICFYYFFFHFPSFSLSVAARIPHFLTPTIKLLRFT